MALQRDGLPYIWAAWFRARHQPDSWQKAKNGSFESWHTQHAKMLSHAQRRWRGRDRTVLVEDQNAFRLRGQLATIAGKPDLVALNGKSAVIEDVKTGRPRTSHNVQLMLCMYAMPRAFPEYRDMVFEGTVVYQDHEVCIPAEAVTPEFIDDVSSLIRRLSADEPPRRVPSYQECRYCDITEQDCPERVDFAVAEAVTEDF